VSPQAALNLKSAGYGLAVFAGMLLLGFVLAPWLGTATGLFEIDVEAQGFFSMLTLKAFPYLAGASVFSAGLYARLATRRPAARLAGYALNVTLAWLAGAGIALLLLG
jgi:hypothetical protein